MNILVITPDYPDDKRTAFSFVKQLVDELARQGNSIQVVAPYSVTHNKRFISRVSTYYVDANSVIVYRPRYLSISNIKFGKQGVTDLIKSRAFRRGLKMLKETPDIVYGHFWSSAYEGFHYAYNHHLPLFVASGESEIEYRLTNDDSRKFCEYVTGVICVSTKNMEESVNLGLTREDKCIVLPNAINPKKFFKKDKVTCRKKLGYQEDSFIVVFVGWFNERKGAKRVSEALIQINKEIDVYSIFIGEGEDVPDCPNILFKGRVQHSLIVDYLNASDVFVLPTLHEGCCNAIIEAMACGLPIVSSNMSFNADVLHEGNSILVNPTDINEISCAIKRMRDDDMLRKELSKNALETARRLSINNRAQRILFFIKKKI